MVLRLNYGLGYTESRQIITGATTILPPAELLAGRNVVYLLDQDSNGNHDIDFDAAFNFPDGFTQPISDAADKRRVLQFVTTYGNTLVYNQDYTTDVPVGGPTDYRSYYDFDATGVDNTGIFTPFIPIGTQAFGTPLGVSALGIGQTTGFNNVIVAPTGSPPAFGNERTIAFWLDGLGSTRVVHDGYNSSYSSYSTFYSSFTVDFSGGVSAWNAYFFSYWYNSAVSASSGSSTSVNSVGSNVLPNHWVAIRYGNGRKIYVNGVLQIDSMSGTPVLNDRIAIYPNFNTINMDIQLNNQPTMDELKVWDRMLSDAEVLALFDEEKGAYGY